MKLFSIPLLISALTFASCSMEASYDVEAYDGSTPELPADAQTYEVGCYGCVFEMEGAVGCQTALKFDGKAVLVEGAVPNAHAMGLCNGVMEATVAGEMDGDVFVASAFSIH